MDRTAISLERLAQTHWKEVDTETFARTWAAELAEIPTFTDSELHIAAPADGVHLNGRQAHRALRHGRQRLRQFEFNLVAPQPQ